MVKQKSGRHVDAIGSGARAARRDVVRPQPFIGRPAGEATGRPRDDDAAFSVYLQSATRHWQYGFHDHDQLQRPSMWP